MQLGQLTRQRQPPLAAERLAQIAQRAAQLVRRFVEDHRALFALQSIQMLAARLFVDRQEALKAPPSGRQAGCRQRADRRTAARNRDNGYIVLGAQRDQILTRIGNRRRARIGYERAGLTGEQLLQNCFTACAAIVFVVRDHRLFGQFAGVKQLLRHAGVLCRDEIHRAEHLACPRR